MRTKFSTHKHNLKAEFYNPYNTDEERLKHCPPCIPMNQWAAFIRCLSTPEKQTVNDVEPSDWQMFCMTHKRKDGSMVAAAQEIKNEFEALSTQLREQSSTTINEDEIFRQVRGPERHGRVRGYGLGPTPTIVFGSTPSRVELMSQLKEANNRNEEMQELKRKMEEDRQKLAAFMEEIRNSIMLAPPQETSDMASND